MEIVACKYNVTFLKFILGVQTIQILFVQSNRLNVVNMVLFWDINTFENIATQNVDWNTSVRKLVLERIFVYYGRNNSIVVFLIYVDNYSRANIVIVRNFGFNIIC